MTGEVLTKTKATLPSGVVQQMEGLTWGNASTAYPLLGEPVNGALATCLRYYQFYVLAEHHHDISVDESRQLGVVLLTALLAALAVAKLLSVFSRLLRVALLALLWLDLLTLQVTAVPASRWLLLLRLPWVVLGQGKAAGFKHWAGIISVLAACAVDWFGPEPIKVVNVAMHLLAAMTVLIARDTSCSKACLD